MDGIFESTVQANARCERKPRIRTTQAFDGIGRDDLLDLIAEIGAGDFQLQIVGRPDGRGQFRAPALGVARIDTRAAGQDARGSGDLRDRRRLNILVVVEEDRTFKLKEGTAGKDLEAQLIGPDRLGTERRGFEVGDKSFSYLFL